MKISGTMLIGAKDVVGTKKDIKAINPATDETLEPTFKGGTSAEVEQACQLAHSAFQSYRETSLEQRAVFLEKIADHIMALGDELIVRTHLESGLPKGRIEGERGRTVNQLRLFASVVRDGRWIDARIDFAQPERKPMPRSDIRLRYIPLGPVAVFGASNFPLAFSVAGGDTASALAAGAPVIVKAHSAHPGTSELVGRAIRAAVAECGLHEGVFSLIFGAGADVGQTLITHPHIKAVAFTGSRTAGVALMHSAAARPEPIPVYAEMSSINPVFLMPGALKANAEKVAQGFVASLLMGAGQFCTNPGLAIGIDSPELDAFIRAAEAGVVASPAATMLTSNIHKAYETNLNQLVLNPNITVLARGKTSDAPNQCRSALLCTSASAFLKDPHGLGIEVFGSSSVVIKCANTDEMLAIVQALEGQLTATLQIAAGQDEALTTSLIAALELKVGRILANGYPTGVEVCHAMVHGGPFPATSDSRTTSVGTAAIYRFLRPVSYQDIPDTFLPAALKNANPLGIPRLESK